jgi:hypothetical protein
MRAGARLAIDKSFLFLFFKKESAFFFEKKKQKTFVREGLWHFLGCLGAGFCSVGALLLWALDRGASFLPLRWDRSGLIWRCRTRLCLARIF